MKYILLITVLYFIYLILSDGDNTFKWWNPLRFSKKNRNKKIREKIRNLVNEQGRPNYYCSRIESPVPIGNSGDMVIFGVVKITKNHPTKGEKYPNTWPFSYMIDKHGEVKEDSPELKILSQIIEQ